MKLRAYNATDLGKEKNGPDNVHYETVRGRIRKDKHIEVIFMTRHKDGKERSIYLPYELSRKIIKALEFYDDFLNGKFKILKINK